MNTHEDPLAFLENYKRIKKLPGIAYPVGYQHPVRLKIYPRPIGPLPEIYNATIGPCIETTKKGAFSYRHTVGPHDILQISSDHVLPEYRMMENILRDVCARTGVSRIDVLSSRHFAPAVRARQIIMYRIRTETRRSLPQIGKFLGGRDHTTILHGVRKVQALIDKGELTI